MAYRRLMVTKLGTSFRSATSLVTESALPAVGESDVLIKNKFVGVNASDINFSAGAYDPSVKPPFPIGFEGVGEVVQVGKGVKHVKEGDAVGFTTYGAYSEYLALPENICFPVPRASKEVIPLLVSGLTASVALEEAACIKGDETVLVTASAGGTGQFAVQLAKLAGCHVIGTCSTPAKAEFVKNLGADRVINYIDEDMRKVLKDEYPSGVDLVYESVGGAQFEAAVSNLAVKGKLMVIGFISGYKDQSGFSSKGDTSTTPLPARLLAKSASVQGFFLSHYMSAWPKHFQKLVQLHESQKLKPCVDPKEFHGLEEVADAVDYLYDGGNQGKVVVSLEQGVMYRPQSGLSGFATAFAWTPSTVQLSVILSSS